MADRVRLAVLGLGRVSAGHLQGWLACPYAEVVALCDSNPQAVQAARERFGLSKVAASSDFREVIAWPQVEAVDICLPDWLHHPAVLAAAGAGKHVLCEKPLAQNAAQAEEMLAAVQRAGVVHQLRLQRRHDPLVNYARDLVRSGALGELRHFRACLSVHRIADPSVGLEWRLTHALSTYGALGDLGVHVLDLAYFLMGEAAGPVTEAAGLGAIFIAERAKEDGSGWGAVTAWDAVSFVVRFGRNVLGSFEVSRFRPGEDYWQVDGQEASLRAQGLGARTLLWYQRCPQEHQRPGAQWQERAVPPAYMGRPNEFEAFCLAILQGRPASPDFSDGLRLNRALDLVSAALERGGLRGRV
jgi:predicted dehydrogenase